MGKTQKLDDEFNFGRGTIKQPVTASEFHGMCTRARFGEVHVLAIDVKAPGHYVFTYVELKGRPVKEVALL